MTQTSDPDIDDVVPSDDQKSAARATERMCALTRQVRPVRALLRFVAGPDGMVVPDIRNRLPGRGVWLGLGQETMRQAIRRKIFTRGLRQDVTVSPTLVEDTARLLREDALQMLSIVNKAGMIVTGFEKIASGNWPMAVLLQAADGSPGEAQRLRGLVRGRGPGRRDPRVILAFSALDLALSIGRESVIHAAVKVHAVSSSFRERADRYVEFLAEGPAERAGDPASGPSVIPDTATLPDLPST